MNSKIEQIHSIINGADICTDTRQIKDGDVFFALKGENFDANDFAQQALEKGAKVAVVERASSQSPKYIVVDDVLKTLQQVATYHRNLFNIPVIGITGSNGKTTTKELINSVLSQKFVTLCTKGNFNNHIGVPLTLLRLNQNHEVAIIEMGANHLGDIDFLSSLTFPTHGLITNIGKAHIEGFGSFENIIKGKTELYRNLKKSGGTIYINGNNQYLPEHVDLKSCITYGKDDDFQFYGKITELRPFLTLKYNTQLDNTYNEPEFRTIKTNLLGAYNFENVMSAIAIGHDFGVGADKIKTGIENYSPTNSRSELKTTARNIIIMDAYNANPTSMMAALENIVSLESDKPKALILGDMLELGETSLDEHQKVIDFIEKENFSWVLLIGTYFAKTNHKKEFKSFVNMSDAENWIKNNTPSGYTFLMKGSRGIKVEQLEKYL
jgi:UDP-N-acetylmuramoyl-tripeptide--D-alanyl-D-alanine ligase